MKTVIRTSLSRCWSCRICAYPTHVSCFLTVLLIWTPHWYICWLLITVTPHWFRTSVFALSIEITAIAKARVQVMCVWGFEAEGPRRWCASGVVYCPKSQCIHLLTVTMGDMPRARQTFPQTQVGLLTLLCDYLLLYCVWLDIHSLLHLVQTIG